MSLRQEKQSLDIKIRASLGKKILIFLPHVIITIILIVLSYTSLFSIIYLYISLLLIVISLIYFIRLHLTLNSKKSINNIHRDLNNNWVVSRINGTINNVEISADSFFNENFIFLNVKDEMLKQSTIIITSDCVNAEQYRKLKVILKTCKIKS